MDQLVSGISMSGNWLKKKNSFFFGSIILAICFSFVVFTSGCLGEEKISEHDAVSIAVNDSRTHNLIQNHEFNVVDVSLASITSGEKNPRDMYAVTIKVQNGTPERIIIFVSFNGEVVRVDSPYTAKAPDDLIKKINETPEHTG